MLPVSAWPPGSPGRWGSPLSVPWLVDLRRYPLGMTIPKGVWMAFCHHNAGVVMRINLSLAVVQNDQPSLLTSIPPIVPLPLLPPVPCSPPPPPPSQSWRGAPWSAFPQGMDEDDDCIVNHTVVAPHHTGTVWSDGWNVRLCGGGRAMLIKVSQ